MSTTAARSTPTTCRFSSWRTLVALGDLDGDDGPELAVGAPFASAGGIEDAGLLQVWSLPGPALSVDAGGPYLGVEGSPVELTAVAIPSGATVAWDVDGDGIFESPGSAVSVSYPDQGQYPVAVEASFGGESVTAGAEVTVVNGAPALEPPPERAGEPGEALIFVAVASDPGSDPLYYSWEWGDGSPPEGGNPASHAYAAVGLYTYTVRVVDGDGGLAIGDSTASIAWRFLRGDVNGDGTVDLGDPVALLGYLFEGVSAPPCADAADANDDGALDVTDTVEILLALFTGSPPPPPYPGCGLDETVDGLLCLQPVPCP